MLIEGRADWLVDSRIGKIGLTHFAFLFTLYAQDVLPFLMPAAVALMEPPGRRRRAIVGLSVVELVRDYAFASVWCFYAAILSVMIYWQFSRRTIAIDTPNEPSPLLRPFLLGWLRRTRTAGTD